MNALGQWKTHFSMTEHDVWKSNHSLPIWLNILFILKSTRGHCLLCICCVYTSNAPAWKWSHNVIQCEYEQRSLVQWKVETTFLVWKGNKRHSFHMYYFSGPDCVSPWAPISQKASCEKVKSLPLLTVVHEGRKAGLHHRNGWVFVPLHLWTGPIGTDWAKLAPGSATIKRRSHCC